MTIDIDREVYRAAAEKLAAVRRAIRDYNHFAMENHLYVMGIGSDYGFGIENSLKIDLFRRGDLDEADLQRFRPIERATALEIAESEIPEEILQEVYKK